MTARAATNRKFDRSQIPPAPDLRHELDLWAQGVDYVAGIDEAGRGALAGPVAAAVVILPPTPDHLTATLNGVRDSKQLSPSQRESCAARIAQIALAHAVGFASPKEIDTLGILPATHLAIRRALDALPLSPDHLLIDHLRLPMLALPQTSLTKGDCRSLSIAAASILAKTARDAFMRELDGQYPHYGFAHHKGYGTPAHLRAIHALGPSPIHRLSFRPLR